MDHNKYTEIFNEAYRRHNDAIFRFCYIQTNDRSLAIDLTQEVFVKFWETLNENKEIVYEKALLYRIARNKVIDHYRKKKSISLEELQENEKFDIGFDESEKKYDEYDGAQVLNSLELIPETYRDIITLRYVEDMSLDEIQEITGEQKNTISVKIHRAVQALRKIYKETNYDA